LVISSQVAGEEGQWEKKREEKERYSKIGKKIEKKKVAVSKGVESSSF